MENTPKTQLDSYLDQQPEKVRDFHRVMKIFESTGFALMILNFIIALVLSFLWKSIPGQAIPTAWLLLPATTALFTILIAVHALVLRIFPPSGLYAITLRGSAPHLPGKSQTFVTGKKALSQAWGLLVIGLIAGIFFAIFAWAAWTVNWALLTPMITILGSVMGIAIALSIVLGMGFKIYQKVSK